eukprot:TRINITY_DN34981_c0_g1_i1.p1 TRINITY_DN34981_c0_g1~~TRINITY_DN34981_c0_g1_i1.p1  ORF type:complete len:333 (-),score=60.51 TRINITY_DN34981_c0_g1_i1:90-1088(-)
MGAALCPGGPGPLASCVNCSTVDAADWLFCLNTDSVGALPSDAVVKKKRRAKDSYADPGKEVDPKRLEELTKDLFDAHDLNDDGMLDESELVRLNTKIAVLHHGKEGSEVDQVQETYKSLFRTKLDPDGKPVPYSVFRTYARELVNELDKDPEAQEMILEQFVAEARSGREAFDVVSLMSDTRTLQERLAEIPSSRLDSTESRHKNPLPESGFSPIASHAGDAGCHYVTPLEDDAPLCPGTGHRSVSEGGQLVLTPRGNQDENGLRRHYTEPAGKFNAEPETSTEASPDGKKGDFSTSMLSLGFESRLICRREDVIREDLTAIRSDNLPEGI